MSPQADPTQKTAGGIHEPKQKMVEKLAADADRQFTPNRGEIKWPGDRKSQENVPRSSFAEPLPEPTGGTSLHVQ